MRITLSIVRSAVVLAIAALVPASAAHATRLSSRGDAASVTVARADGSDAGSGVLAVDDGCSECDQIVAAAYTTDHSVLSVPGPSLHSDASNRRALRAQRLLRARRHGRRHSRRHIARGARLQNTNSENPSSPVPTSSLPHHNDHLAMVPHASFGTRASAGSKTHGRQFAAAVVPGGQEPDVALGVSPIAVHVHSSIVSRLCDGRGPPRAGPNTLLASFFAAGLRRSFPPAPRTFSESPISSHSPVIASMAFARPGSCDGLSSFCAGTCSAGFEHPGSVRWIARRGRASGARAPWARGDAPQSGDHSNSA